MKNSQGLLMIKFISLELNNPRTMIVEPYFIIDHPKSFETPVPYLERAGTFKWPQERGEATLSVEIPREASQVHLILCDRSNNLLWGLCRLEVSELEISPLQVQLDVNSNPITRPLDSLLHGDIFLGANLTFAYDFFPRVYNTYRKFDLTSYFMALAMRSEVVDPDGDSFYINLDGFRHGNSTMNGIGAYNALEGAAGQGFIWYHWGPAESMAADDIEGFELGEFNESTQNHIIIDVYRVANDTLVATGALQFGILNDSNETHSVPLYGGDSNEVGKLFLNTEMTVRETFEQGSGYAGATSPSEERSSEESSSEESSG